MKPIRISQQDQTNVSIHEYTILHQSNFLSQFYFSPLCSFYSILNLYTTVEPLVSSIPVLPVDSGEMAGGPRSTVQHIPRTLQLVDSLIQIPITLDHFLLVLS